MSDTEVFSQDRMNRCAEIQRAIMTNWLETNSFDYVVRATERVSGIDLSELRKHYFSVGIGNDVRDIPFHDMLVVFSTIEHECAALEKRKTSSETKGETEFTIKYQISISECVEEEEVYFN